MRLTSILGRNLSVCCRPRSSCWKRLPSRFWWWCGVGRDRAPKSVIAATSVSTYLKPKCPATPQISATLATTT